MTLGTIVSKITKRVRSVIKKLLYMMLYGGRIKIGKSTVLYPRTHIVIDDEGKIEIGKNCFFNCNCSITSLKNVKIGDGCIFGENVCIYDHNHRFSSRKEEIRKQGFKADDVIIEDNCWICSNVTILKGVTIGEGSVISAGCIVCSDVPSNTIVRMNRCVEYEKRK
jgi:acetyltransferase-like isoleucine patch superfamily enzyme